MTLYIRFYNLTSGQADMTWSTLILVTKTIYYRLSESVIRPFFVSFADLCEKILSEEVLERQVEKLLDPVTSGSIILHLAKPI